ncbi:MAG: ureidoglycolate lyase [Phyllobacterium sp.]|uniref:ureidoglycolate lyase n=1 Tax=Phyllobacterium sp. TaxID=1871046 RepID=UPI0030F2A5E3
MEIASLGVVPLTRAAFAPYGDVIQAIGAQMRPINGGTTQRFHDLANIDVTGEGARVLVNIFRGQSFAPPIDIKMLERHPLGSQAFMPLQDRPYLAVVAVDEGGRPGTPVAFLCKGNQGVNYARNAWHHPLISLEAESDFLVVDRGGEGNNLEEFFFADCLYRIDSI